MVHESLHATIEPEFYGWSKRAEEEVVDKITREVMEDVRELPRLARRPHG
jgi:hypothetical protein